MFLFSPALLGQGAALLQLQQINATLLGMTFSRRTQVASASNRNIVVGNLGLVRTGAQQASPLNVGPR